MGKYFINFFERNGFEVIISDKKTALSNKQLCKKSDVVIVSVSIDKTEEVIKEVAPLIKKTGLLLDLTSFKVFPMKAMSKTKASYLGCHPLFGPSAPIGGQLVILCPGRGKKWHNWLKSLFERNKVVVRDLDAEKHDELMAYIQALTHFTDIALVDTLRKSKIPISKFLSYESPIYRLELDMMGRILNQDPNLYANIQIKNPISNKVIKSFIKSRNDLSKTIDEKDVKSNINYFKRCSKYLGSFCKTAMEESDRLISYLNISPKKSGKNKSIKYDIAVLGPRNTYSDIAVYSYAPKAEVRYCSSITQVFELVSSGKIKQGLVPLENSLTGSVRETLDELYSHNVIISNVINQPINLALVGVKKVPLKNIKTIYSHPQPLLQSRIFLNKNIRKANRMPVASTITALERVSRERKNEVVAIASPFVAKQYGLVVIRDSIQGNVENTTKFAVIIKNKQSPLFNKKCSTTSIAFNFDKDSPGSLFIVLQHFAEYKINMTKIESRPNPKMQGEYVFYIDFEGNINKKNTQQVLNQIKKKVARMKVLGCYNQSNSKVKN